MITDSASLDLSLGPLSALLWNDWLMGHIGILRMALQHEDDLRMIFLELIRRGLEALDKHRVQRLKEALVMTLRPEHPLLGLQVIVFLRVVDDYLFEYYGSVFRKMLASPL